jgi:hypothetical protein
MYDEGFEVTFPAQVSIRVGVAAPATLEVTTPPNATIGAIKSAVPSTAVASEFFFVMLPSFLFVEPPL